MLPEPDELVDDELEELLDEEALVDELLLELEDELLEDELGSQPSVFSVTTHASPLFWKPMPSPSGSALM